MNTHIINEAAAERSLDLNRYAEDIDPDRAERALTLGVLGDIDIDIDRVDDALSLTPAPWPRLIPEAEASIAAQVNAALTLSR